MHNRAIMGTGNRAYSCLNSPELDRLIFEFKTYGSSEVFWHLVRKFAKGGLREFALAKMRKAYAEHDRRVINFLKNLEISGLENYVKDLYFERTGEVLDLKSPQNFNQKIQWLKIHDNQEIKCKLSDKFAVREWIKDKIGEKYLIKLFKVWDSADEINFDGLPDKFFLCPNHASGSNLIVNNKNLINLKDVQREAAYWLSFVYGVVGYEPQYFDIPRKILAEEFIQQSDGDLLDYKIHCFNSEPKIIQIIGGRDLKTHTAHEAFFAPDWTRNDLMYHTYEQYDKDNEPKRPANFDEILDISRELSKGFKYVRVDLYNLDGNIKFGEMTFTPACGFSKWASEQSSKTAGDFIEIN